MTIRRPAAEQPPTLVGGLPPALTDLIAAIHDALNVPLADRPVDDKARIDLLTRRTCDTRALLELLLAHGDIARTTLRLREWTAEHPVTYPTWQARTVQTAAEEQQLLADESGVTRPFPWMNGPRARLEQLSRAEVRERGEGQ